MRKSRPDAPDGSLAQGGGALYASTASAHQEAELRSRNRAGLAGHGAVETLALEGSGEVHFALGEKAGEEGHDRLRASGDAGCLGQLSGMGQLVDDADIGICIELRRWKSEVPNRKYDTTQTRHRSDRPIC
jgi:hypothetical protein